MKELQRAWIRHEVLGQAWRLPGMFFGAAFYAIPGIGAVLVAGPLVAWITGALEGAGIVGGSRALGPGLYSIRIPKDSLVECEAALKADKFQLLAHGNADEVAQYTRWNASHALEADSPVIGGKRRT